MPQHTYEEILKTFKALVKDNNQAVKKLSAQEKEAKGAQDSLRRDYAQKLEQFITGLFVPSVNEDALHKIGATSGANFLGDYQKMVQANEQARQHLDDLQREHQNVSTVRIEMAAVQDAYRGAEQTRRASMEKMEDLNRALAKVDAFNAKAASKGQTVLNAGTLGEFDKNGFTHFAKMVFSSRYRQGRRLIAQSVKKHGADIPTLQATRTAQEKTVSRDAEAVAARNREVKALENIIADFEATQNAIRPNEVAVCQVATEIVRRTEKNAHFFRGLARDTAETMPPEIVEARAKMESYQKVIDWTGQQVSALKRANGNLDIHIDKLERTVNRGKGYKTTEISLGKIEKSFKANQALTAHMSAEIDKIMASIKDFNLPVNDNNKPVVPVGRTPVITGTTTSSPSSRSYAADPFDFYLDYFLIMNLMDAATDPFVVNAVMGIPGTVADVAHIALDGLTPALDWGVNGLSELFNGASLEGVGNAMEALHIPDVSDFTLPDIDLSGIGDAAGGIGDALGDVFSSIDF